MTRHLPLAVAMQVTVKSWNGRQLCLAAPLVSNLNDKGTAFGGSLISLATLTCWGICWLGLLRDGVEADLVLRQQSSRFMRPVTDELQSCAECMPASLWQEQLLLFEEQGHADLVVTSQVMTINRAGAKRQAMDYESVFRLRPLPA